MRANAKKYYAHMKKISAAYAALTKNEIRDGKSLRFLDEGLNDVYGKLMKIGIQVDRPQTTKGTKRFVIPGGERQVKRSRSEGNLPRPVVERGIRRGNPQVEAPEQTLDDVQIDETMEDGGLP